MSSDRRFEAFLKELIGLDVSSVGAASIGRAVRQRIASGVTGNADEYWALLQTSAAERQALIEAVIVPETWFFRYPESFTTLAQLAVQRLAILAGVRPLRLLSLPCATGEEPYSMVMSLLDAGIPGQAFQVDALDVSPLLIARAKRAVYGKNSFRSESLAFREQYFAPVKEGYELSETVCRQVRFQCGNLLDPQLLASEPAYDVVFCRNLLIYFDRATQETVLSLLKRLTREDGVLFIGPAEASLLSQHGMQALGIPQSFAFQYPSETLPAKAAWPEPAALDRVPVGHVSARTSAGRPSAETRTRPAQPRSSGRRLNEVKPQPPATKSGAPAQLEAIANLANQGRLDEARQGCERYLAEHGPAAEAFYWLGLLSDAGGKPQEAQGYYRKVLYLQPQHREALAHLAALLAAQGDAAGARRLQARAERGVSKDG